MFVLSLTSKKIKFASICFVSVILVLSCSLLILYKCNSGSPKNNELLVNNSALNIEEILEFISSFGWEVSAEPDEIREVVIPVEFDDVYKDYNQIQLSQGYDLTQYAGQRAKNWTFTVLNYPGYEGKEYIKINLLICNGTVIGGDVCSVRLDGFMHGFSKE